MNPTMRGLFCIGLLVVLTTGIVKAVENKQGTRKGPERHLRPPTPTMPATSSTVSGHRLLLGGTELRHVYLLDTDGKVVRTISNVNGPFQAELLENGNILIAGGKGKQVLEVAPNDTVVWQISADELPGEPLKFVAGIQRLPNGNTLFVNWPGHISRAPTAQMLEVTPAKKIVWRFRDWESFSALSSVQVLAQEHKAKE